MDEAFDLSFDKAIFIFGPIADGNTLGHIRYGSVMGSDGYIKHVAFFASLIDAHFIEAAGKDMMRESDAVAKSQAPEGARYQAYEWLNSEFVSVDPAQQSWFDFAYKSPGKPRPIG